MASQIFFVTSVRGIFFPPQIVANAGERTLGAKMPMPFFFMARAFFFPAAFIAFLPAALFTAVIFLSVAFVGLVVFTFVVVVLVVISIKRWKCTHAMSLEPTWLRS